MLNYCKKLLSTDYQTFIETKYWLQFPSFHFEEQKLDKKQHF